jgi:hypothetical protein
MSVLPRKPLEFPTNAQALILELMQAMLRSTHFSKSKKYPALLEYCVRHTLSGELSALKERIIGCQVFSRAADYDTNSDPVVRISAGEVRKRIALFFDEHPHSPVRIDLPRGSYVCEFQFREQTSAELTLVGAELKPRSPSFDEVPALRLLLPDASGSKSPRLSARYGRLMIALAVIGCAAALIGVRADLRRESRLDPWRAVLQNNVPAVIVTGQRNAEQSVAAQSVKGTIALSEALPTMAVGNAVTIGQICGVFQKFDRPCDIVASRTATLTDLRNKSIVLVGAFDNPWTERLLAPLRFQFSRKTADNAPGVRRFSIVDRNQTVGHSPWNDDFSISPGQMKADYFVIARFHSDITEGDVLVAAGIWTQGTQSAGEFITSPRKMAQLLSLAPAGWKGTNFEAVLETDVIQEQAGPTKILATNFW